jgi:hypothetical protein
VPSNETAQLSSDQKRFRYIIGCLVVPMVLVSLSHDDHHPIASWNTLLMIVIGVPAGFLMAWVGIRISNARRTRSQ